MYIITEDTPNPDVKKFLPHQDVTGSESVYEFTHIKQAEKSPLAHRLFHIDGVTGVFLGRDFVSVTKQADIKWEHIRIDIIDVISEHFLVKAPLLNEQQEDEKIIYDDADESIVKQLVELIDTRVRPAVAQDGGDIQLHAYREGVVYVRLKGACSGCPSSSITLKNGIENMLKHYLPDVQEVKSV